MKLKNISILACCLSMLFSATSCKDFLDQTDPNHITTGIYWNNLDDCQKGLTAVYNAYKDEAAYQWKQEHCRSDIAWPNGHSHNAFPKCNDLWHMHTYNADTSQVNAKWAALYLGIFRTNQVFEGLEAIKPQMESDDDIKEWNLIFAQATFFRALFHYYIYSAYNEGNIPLVTSVPKTETDFYYPCTKREKVQEFIRNEMTIAESMLPSKGSKDDWDAANIGRPRSEAASAIIGLTYLCENEPVYKNPTSKPNYAKAGEYFKKIIDNANYKLVDVSDNFTSRSENNDESILEINYTLDYNSSYAPNNDSYLGNSLSLCVPAPSVSMSGGNNRYIPAYWLYRAYAKEPVEKLDANNKVYLKTDYHNDIYYFNNDKEYVIEGEDAIGKYLKYFVVIKFREELNGKIATIASNTGKNAKAMDPMIYGRYYVVLKTLYVKDFASREPIDEHLEYSNFISKSLDGKRRYAYEAVQEAGGQSMSQRPYKAMQNEGTWELYNEGTDENPIYYRYRTNSRRASNSIVMATDEDTPYYQAPRMLDNATMNEANTWFRKYSNWDIRTDEFNDPNAMSAINIRLIRLATVYLWYAECLLEGGQTADDANVKEAMMYVNLIRKRAGTVLIGNAEDDTHGLFSGCSFQGGENPDTNYDKDANEGYTSYEWVDLYGTGNTEVTNTADLVMKHIMYFESPLETSTEGYMQRFIDLRRWNVVKARFQDLAKMDILKTSHAYADIQKYERDGDKSLTAGANLLDYDEKMVWSRNGMRVTQFDLAAIGYSDACAYYPIPYDEVVSNPNIKTLVE